MDTNNYEEGFRLAFENAKRLFKSAEALENEKEFPVANSLLILAAEEGVKAYTILIKHFLPDKNLDSYKMVFKDHTFKLQFLSGIVLFVEIIKKFYEYFHYPVLQNADKTPEEITKIKSRCIKKFVNWSKRAARSETSKLSKQLDWWENAKTMKEKGFYVGHNNKKWVSPSLINRKDYLRTKKYVEEFFQLLDYIYGLDFHDKSTRKDFSEIKQSMEKIYKEKIEGHKTTNKKSS